MSRDHGVHVDFNDPVITATPLILNEDKKMKPVLANAIAVLRTAPEWYGTLAYNEFSLRVTTKIPAPWQKAAGAQWTDHDDCKTCEWLQHQGLLINTHIAAEAAQTVAKENPFHPVREYLGNLKWDGQPRIEKWLSTYLGAIDTPYTRGVGPRWLISGVARILRPGCQADYTLLLEGEQGIQKSSVLRALVGDDYFADHIGELGSKDSRIDLQGRWVIEMAELDKVRGGALERVKAFLTSRIDSFRPPYGRRTISVPRSCIFAGTVNDATPLTDSTGGRRFWPVRCGVINVARIAEDRDQLWAEAYDQFKAGAPWWPDTAELNQLATKEQDERYNGGALDDIIMAWCNDPQQSYRRENDALLPVEPFDSIPGRVTVADILLHCLEKSRDRISPQKDANEVVRCLTHHKWKRNQFRIKGQRKWFYYRTLEAEL